MELTALENRTIKDILSLDLNKNYIDELVMNKQITREIIEKNIKKRIDSLRTNIGFKLRPDKKRSMRRVYMCLYDFINFGDGNCSPSMDKMAIKLNLSKKTDKKTLHASKIVAWRAIHALEEYGFIRIHEYRAESNREMDNRMKKLYYKRPNFFYELVQLSTICEDVKSILNLKQKEEDSKAIKKLDKAIDYLVDRYLKENNNKLTDRIFRLICLKNDIKNKHGGILNGEFITDFRQRRIWTS